MKASRLALFLVALLLILLGPLAAGPAAADGPGGQSEVALEGLPPADPAPGQESVVLSARASDGSGQPLGGLRLTFYVLTNIFGERLMTVGEALTDTTGVASLVYKPGWAGDQPVVVRFAGDQTYRPAQSTFRFAFAGPVPVHENARFGLEPVRRWLPFAIGTVVLAVWAILGLVVVRTVVGIPAAAAVEPVREPSFWAAPPRSAPARGGLVLVAVVVLVAAPVTWLVFSDRGRDGVSMSTESARFVEGVGTGGGAPGAVSDTVTAPEQPLAASLVQSVALVGGDVPDPADLPADVALIEGRAFVLDTNNGRILAVTRDGRPGPLFESAPDGDGWLGGALAMVSGDGRLYVANTQAGNVMVVAPPGVIERLIVPQAPPGAAPLTPSGIAVTEDGEIWLSDAANHRVLLLSAQGELLGTIGEGAASSAEAGLDTPGGLTLDELGNLYVVDTGNRVVKMFSPLGVFLGAIGGGRLASPSAVAVDSEARVFVSDEKLARVVAFGPDGGYLGSLGGGDADAGGPAARFQVPYGLKADGGRLYVMDRLVGLLVFDLNGQD
ncbi:MAG TPA: hypothetical protein VFT91_06830 [Dehalococcoidia bacterium]|nr:hypothetical protein [Dehalococcoidia bacterium]